MTFLLSFFSFLSFSLRAFLLVFVLLINAGDNSVDAGVSLASEWLMRRKVASCSWTGDRRSGRSISTVSLATTVRAKPHIVTVP